MNNIITRAIPVATRAILATVIVCLVIILTQDFQIFPEVIGRIWFFNNRNVQAPPETVEQIFFETADHKKLEAWRLPAERSGKVALVFHGNAGTLGSFFHYQKWLKGLGLTSYAFDYRGYGQSEGWPSEAGLQLDSLALWELVQKGEGVAAKDVLLLGISLGTGPATWLARQIGPGSLMLLSPYKSIPDVAQDNFFLRYLKAFTWHRFPIVEHLPELGQTCIIIAHGKRDSTIKVHHSIELARSLRKDQKHFLILNDQAGHNDLFGHTSRELEETLGRCNAY